MNDWRTSCHVLVSEAQTIGSLAVVRSLGRAGYRVIASSPQADALGFYSRYCHVASVHPPYSNSEQFFDWLDQVLRREQINLIIPSESFLLAVRPMFAELHPLLPLPKDENLVYRALSKWDLFQAFVDGGLTDHLPPFCLIDEDDVLPTSSELRALGEPLFLKLDGLYSRDGSGGDVIKCDNSDFAVERLKTLRARYRKVLVQGYVRGIGVGAFFAQWHDQLLGEFMHRRIHEVPHTGGVSSFRETWSHLPIMDDAKVRAAYLGWQGVGMFEYRWDPTSGRFFLIEFNSRFWGSLHLAMFAGVDFPRLLTDAFFDHANPRVTDYHLIRCRLAFPGEVQYVWSCFKDASLRWPQRLWPLLNFAILGLDPRVYSDLSYPGDRALYWRMMMRSIRRFVSQLWLTIIRHPGRIHRCQ